MVRTSEKMRNVAISWCNGEYYSHNENFLTTGEDVFSYGHRIAYTSPTDEKVLVDCHFSVTTAAQCNVLRELADRVELCRAHPKPGVIVKDTRPVDQLAGKVSANTLYAGIEDAIKALKVVPCTTPTSPGVVNDCQGPAHPVQMQTCSKCWVIVGLRNVLEGRRFDAEPTT